MPNPGNYTDIQEITVTINQGQTGVAFNHTHNLVDELGNPATPDEVKVEITNDIPVESGICLVSTNNIIRSAPESGTVVIICRGDNACLLEGGLDLVLRVISKYNHSIQTDDHVANASVGADQSDINCLPQ